MKNLTKYMLLAAMSLLVACSPKAPVLPTDFDAVAAGPQIYPDYTDVVIPCNIAPLVFRVVEDADDYVTRFKAGDSELLLGGREVAPAIGAWHSLLESAKGGALSVEVYVATDGKWKRYEPFSIGVSADAIDRYISYRLIPPSYVAYEKLDIMLYRKRRMLPHAPSHKEGE